MSRKRCHACGQKLPQLHKFALNSVMAMSLITLYQFVDGDTTKFVYIRDPAILINLNIGGDFAMMRWWGLIKRKTKFKRDRALWRITRRGVLFVQDKISISRFIVIKRDHNGPLEASDDLIDIRGALRKRFDYDELFTA